MIKFDVNMQNNITNQINKIKKKLKKVPQEAYDFFYDQTPIRSGNARSKTKLKKDTIVANYPYAQRLDEGYSKQAPKGMTEPTQKFVDKRVKDIMAGK